MLLVVIIIALLAVIVVLLLPAHISSKIAGMAVAIGVIFTAYGLYLNAKVQRREQIMDDINLDDAQWTNIYRLFITNPDLNTLHRQIYGSSLPSSTHSMLSIFMQTLEDNIRLDNSGFTSIDMPFINITRKWISIPEFSIFWEENKDQYDPSTQLFIDAQMRIIGK